MNLNGNQIIAIILVVLGVLTASTAQLNDLLGPVLAHVIVSVASLSMAILSGVLGVLTGQASAVRAVSAMPGVEKILVNAQANQTLAKLAVAEDQDKVQPTPQAQSSVAQIAKGA